MSRNFIFTWNNYNDESEKYLRSLAAKYICYGKEIAPSTGTPHLQGYIMFNSVKTLSAAIKLLPGCHVQVAVTVEAGINYCKKDGDVTEIGQRPMLRSEKGAKEKERWQRAKELAIDNRVEEIDADIYLRLYPTLKKIAVDHMVSPPDLETLENTWICGPSGCGKSRSVRAEYPCAYNKDPKTRWWDGYTGQETIVIDDLDIYDKSIGGDLKRWVDHYPFPAQMKGSSVVIRPKRVIVTSQYTPEEIWDDPKTLEALNRRFNVKNMYGSPKPFVDYFKK